MDIIFSYLIRNKDSILFPIKKEKYLSQLFRNKTSLLLSIWNLNNIVSIELLIKLIQVLLLMLHHLYAEQS